MNFLHYFSIDKTYKMKYGKYEYERIFLLDNDCLRNKRIESTKKIKDKYLKDTNLRLREVKENNSIKFKLTKKEKLNPDKKGILKLNTLYLTKSEFDKFYIFDGFEIKKERHMIQVDQIRIGIDNIILSNMSLFIAEVEFETEDKMNTFSMPLSYIKEITGEKQYSGFELAKVYSKSK